MQGPCQTVDASQLLRDILQNKEKYQDKIIDNNNSTSSNGSGIFPSIDCNSEMISPLLQSKSSDMAYNDRDNDTEGENDNDIDVTVDNNSTVNSGDESDLDVRSLEPGDLSKGSENGLVNGETKAAKRAHVENILSSMRKSPLEEEMENAMRNSTGVSSESKRQKRKQPQPQQHDSAILNTSDYPMHIMQLQCNIDDRMQTVKRKREDCDDVVCSDIDDDDTINDDDIDVSTDDGRVKVSTPLLGNDAKRAHAQRILSAIRSPNYPCENGVESQHDVSPNGDGSKKQKRKQAQPQQHDGKMMSAIDLEEFRFRHGSGNKLYSSKGDGSVNGDEVGRDSPNNNNINNNISNSINNNHNIHNNIHSTLFPNHDAMFRASLFRGLNEKDFTLPFHNGVDPHLYRENLFRHPLFGLRPDLDPMAAFRNMSRGHPGRIDPELLHGGQRSLSPTQVTKISEALKNELNQAVSKAIDKALSKVFSDKHLNNNKEENSAEVNAQPPQDSQRQQQQTPKSQPTPLIPPQFPLLPHHNQFSQQQHQQQQQQQQQQHHHQHQQPQQQSQHSPSHASDREAHKENVNNSQGEKKPELTVPFSDHLQLLERFGSRVHPEKVSAFEPLYKSESELITPHTGPSMPFHPPFPYYLPTQTVPNTFTGEPEQTEALPLIVNTPKKKRTKVTDTRLSSPRTKPSLLSESSPGSSSLDQMEHQRHLAAAFTHFMPQVLPTSVAITNPSLNHSDLLALRLREASFGGSRLPSPHDQSRSSPCSPNTDSPHFMMKMEMYERSGLGLGGADVMDGQGNGSHMTSTLTPMHLRKAKLMFFYSRYPSSSVLKMYFPDVMFNKNNTAQLVKWFSNFREFFYIQMEKYARQAQAEGCKHADDLVVTADSELFRHLNLHYNRNNQVEVPENFHLAVEAALKEFFKAIQANKDAEPSWKKAIYKIISRMDETLPEFFKSANWMEQLGDQ